MASIVLAASVALVKPVIEKLSSKQLKDISMLWRLDQECDKVKDSLTIISLVLEDAEKRSITNNLIKSWLSQLQDVAFDVDDLLDELQIEELQSSKCNSLLRVVGDFFSSRNQVKFRSKMVKKVKKINKRLDKIIQEKKYFHFVEENIPTEEDNPIRETSSGLDESEVCGRQKEKVEVIRLLIHDKTDETLSVLSMVGMGGVGKTTLARLIYNDEEVRSYFDLVVWVHVPMDFKLSIILNKIIRCLSENHNYSDFPNIQEKQDKLQRLISGTRFLIILDDVWNENVEVWEKLRAILRCGMVGSKILITTRSNIVGKIVGTFDQYQVNPLDFQDSWELFERRAFKNVSEEEKEGLVNTAKDIVQQCKGLPLALKHLGNLIGSKSIGCWDIGDSDIWKRAECLSGIIPSLLLSYFYLPSHVKRCFEYCSLFPKGLLVKREYLTHLWICEGFIPCAESPTQLERAANSCFDLLVSRSFFEYSGENYGGSQVYKMHDLIHHMACYVAGDKFLLSGRENKQSVVSWRYSSLCSSDMTRIKKLRSLLLPLVSGELDSIMQLRYLRVLDLSDSQIKELPCKIDNLRHLRYLNLSGNALKTIPDSVDGLINLKVLDLSLCFELKEIPTNLGALENLEVLSLYHCIVLDRLPESLCRLTNLRCLDLTDCWGLVSIPNGIGKLSNLERLPSFIHGGQGGCTVSELNQMNSLKHKLKIVCKGECDLQDLLNANLKVKQYLKSLEFEVIGPYVRSGVDSDAMSILPIGSLQLPCQLETFCVRYVGKGNFRCDIPSSLRSMYLNKLVNVLLDGVNECQCFPQFGQLPRLKFLHLSLCFPITRIKEQFSGSCGLFPVLEELELNQDYTSHIAVPGETVVETEATRIMFPCLKKVRLDSCPFIAVFPSLPKSIEYLEIRGHCVQQNLSIRSLQGLSRLRKLTLRSVSDICPGFEGMMNLTALEELMITNTKWSYLPPGLRQHHLPSLKNLKISHMASLRLIEEEILVIAGEGCSGRQPPPLFAALEKLVIKDCNSLAALPDWLWGLSCMKLLRVEECPEIKEFPESMSRLITLNMLQLSGCTNIRSLPKSFEGLTALQSLRLEHLPNLQGLPKGTEQIASLKNLTITGCSCLSRQWRIDGKDEKYYYKREEDVDWFKISHIQCINIFPVLQHVPS